MLKIKDNVDLRKLKEYNFALNYIDIFSDRILYFELKDDRYIRERQYDVLYDLIKAGLVEKVGEDNE